MRYVLFLSIMLVCAQAFAQANLEGVWDNLAILHEDWPDRLFGPELGDYTGVPLNDAARFRADAWDASLITLLEYQCRVHPSDYVPSFAGMRIWEERDKDSQQLIAIHTHHFAWGTERTIWMDGRPHPPEYAMHTAMGFSTGKWDGVISVVDPKYYTEPVVRSRDYEYEVNGDIGPYPCEAVDETDRPKGVIPHHLPGTNPFLTEYAKAHNIPAEAARGGAETMYPEYRKKLREMMKAQSSGGK